MAMYANWQQYVAAVSQKEPERRPIPTDEREQHVRGKLHEDLKRIGLPSEPFSPSDAGQRVVDAIKELADKATGAQKRDIPEIVEYAARDLCK